MAEKGEEMKLLATWFSPFAYRVIWVLKMKGIEYEYVEEDLGNKSPLLLQSNPVHKKVPVLIHNGKPLAESLVIVQYLDNICKSSPVLPDDPYQRAMALFWSNFVEEKFTENIKKVLVLGGEEQAAGAKGAEAALATLEAQLAKKKSKFFGGESIGLVDIALGYISVWLEEIEEVGGIKVFDSEKFPCLAKWMQDFLEIPTVKENHPNKADLIPYLRYLRQVGPAVAFQHG
ncbi:probable glutathione S-transferase [Diospyros lotus]|uniref:probable glutathione S-transferase n=1 Tax=Diospyros lotus TaxID=55363 RepID=UPI0022586C1D|nr:probable glutathione S-transferase [Diospyros lotus]